MTLTITGTNYQAEGPYTSTNNLKSQSGVYIITGTNTSSTSHRILDIGESGDIKTRVSSHDRSDQWKRQGYTTLHVSAIYCNERERMTIEQQLRNHCNPPCGDR